jgi:hypothetical protein
MTRPISYKRHRFPPQIIAHAVWLYFRFPLSLRLVEEMLLERGIVVSYETIRRWGKKFGPVYARRLRRKQPSPHDVWHLDEVVISIAGKKHWLWRAVDQDGYVLDEIVQSRRDTNGPDPSNWSIGKTTFPGNLILEEGQYHEEDALHGRADRLCAAPSGERHTGL